jgi:MFS family permease
MQNLRKFAAVLRHRDFRFLWLAESTSVIGDSIVTVALALFVIDLTGSATDLGLVLAAYSLPLVALLLVGGVWADRLPRHRLMIATDLARFVLHGLLAILIISGEVQIWQVIVIGVLFGAAEAFSRPAATGLLPQTVPEDAIQEASAATAMSNNVAEFIGPALAAALVLGVGAGAAFAVDSATFILSAAFLTRVRPRPRGPSPTLEKRRSVREEIHDGYREVRSRAWVWVSLAVISVTLFVALAPWFVLGPVIAREQYVHIGVYGIAAATFGAGTVIGSVLGIGWRPRYPMRLGMFFLFLWPPSMILYAAGVTLYVTLPAMLFSGACVALFDVWWVTALAERIPPQRLSRVTSYDWMVSLGLLPLGYLLAGPLSNALGAVAVLLGGSVIALLVTALGILPRETRMLERVDGDGTRVPVNPATPGVPIS